MCERLCLLSWDYADPKGGMGRSLRTIVDQLRGAGRAVDVLSPSPDQGPPILRMTRWWGGHLVFSALLPFALASRLRRLRSAALIVPVGPGGVFLLRRPHVPCIAVVYHTYLQQARSVPGQRWKRLFIPFERRTLQSAEQILCFCADTQRVLQREYGLRNALLLPHPIAQHPRRVSTRDAHVLCVARLEARKGVGTLLRAWPLVRERVPDARLTIVGRGVLEGRVDADIARLSGVIRRVDLSSSAMRDVLASSAVAVCPSYLEGFGLAAAEAMAVGVPVVASDVDGLRSLIVHGETGWLIPPGDTDGLAEAIVTMLTDENIPERLSSSAWEYVRQHHEPAACGRALVDAVSVVA